LTRARLRQPDTRGDFVARWHGAAHGPHMGVSSVPVLHSRALLARARGEHAEYRSYRDRYRALAQQAGYEGHIARADALP
jgi:hypothetical protein